MKFVSPFTQKLSIEHNGMLYEKTIYEPPLSLSGVVDENYPNYYPAATYNTGDYVIVPELKTIYRCSADGVSGVFPLSDPSKWVDWGFVNSYKMLSTDEQIGAQTVGVDIVMELPFSRRDTLGLVNTQFMQLHLELIDLDTNEVVDDIKVSGRDIGCTSFAEYFYDEIREKSRVIVDGLMWLPNSKLRLTFSGDVKIGSIVSGCARELGITLMGTELSFEDRSKILNDEFTNTRKVIRYGHVRVLKAKVLFDVPDFDVVAQKVGEIIGKNVLFIPSEKDRFSEMTNIAYIEDFSMPIENPVIFEANTTIVGVV